MGTEASKLDMQLIDQGFDGERRIAFGAVVHEDIRAPILCYSLFDQAYCVPSRVRQFPDNFVVRFCRFLRCLVGYFQWSQEAQSELNRTLLLLMWCHNPLLTTPLLPSIFLGL